MPFLAAAEPLIPPPLVERLKQTSIPSFQLDQATIHEALAQLKSEWIRQHPVESFPVVLIETKTYGNPRITLDLKAVPFWVVVQALGNATGLAVRDDGKTIRIDMEPEEDSVTKVSWSTKMSSAASASPPTERIKAPTPPSPDSA